MRITNELCKIIREIYYELLLSDKEIISILEEQGFIISLRGYIKFRKTLGIFRKYISELLAVKIEKARTIFRGVVESDTGY